MKTHKIFKKFNLYEEIVRHNYMYHEELIHVTKKRLNILEENRSITFLDLGCGDAYLTSQLFPKEAPINYVGVDLSESALKDAEINLSGYSGWEVDLHCEDLLDFLKKNNTKFQIISCGFSLHHLKTEDKKKVFKEVKKSLKPGGLFLLYDVVRGEETVDEINRKQIEVYKKAWAKIPSDSMQLIEEHMINEDFPEALTTYEKWGGEIGFSQSEILYRTPHEFYVLIEYKN